MSKDVFRVRITPAEAFAVVKDEQSADLVHEELHNLGNGKQVGTMVFEKYYFRTKNRAALIVMMDNLAGTTEVRVVATGSSQGVFFNFDWGAGDDFVASVSESLSEYQL